MVICAKSGIRVPRDPDHIQWPAGSFPRSLRSRTSPNARVPFSRTLRFLDVRRLDLVENSAAGFGCAIRSSLFTIHHLPCTQPSPGCQRLARAKSSSAAGLGVGVGVGKEKPGTEAPGFFWLSVCQTHCAAVRADITVRSSFPLIWRPTTGPVAVYRI